MPGVIKMQDVLTTDPLRKSFSVRLRSTGTLTAAASKDMAMVHGLPDAGGTIIGVYARCLTKPTGTVTALTLDVNRNGTTIFTTQTNRVIFTKTAAGSLTANSTTIEAYKVYNGDSISLDVDAIGNGGAGANLAVAVAIRVDCAND